MPRDLPLSNGGLLVMFDLCPTCGQTMRDHVRHSDQVPMLTGTAAGGG